MSDKSPYVRYFDPADDADLLIVANGTTTLLRPTRYGKNHLRIAIPAAAVFDGGTLTVNRLDKAGHRKQLASWNAPDKELVRTDGAWWKLEFVMAGAGAACNVPVPIEGWNEGDDLLNP